MRTIDEIKRTLNGALVRFAAGHHINCPRCGRILDGRQTVVTGVEGRLPDETEDRSLVMYVLCGRCHDRQLPTIEVAIERVRQRRPGAVVRLEIMDGRQLLASAMHGTADARSEEGSESSPDCS